MAHFAQIDENNIVVNVIVAEQPFIDLLPDRDSWIQTSYNTALGQHTGGKTPLRKNYAGIGYTYDRELDAFIPPRTFPSWILNVNTGAWDAPVPYPKDGKEYTWNEEKLNWVEVHIPPDPNKK